MNLLPSLEHLVNKVVVEVEYRIESGRSTLSHISIFLRGIKWIGIALLREIESSNSKVGVVMKILKRNIWLVIVISIATCRVPVLGVILDFVTLGY